MAEGKGKAALLLLLLVGGGAAAVAYSKNASAADPKGPANNCRWQLRDNGNVDPGEFFAISFDAPADWTDADVVAFKNTMTREGFDQTQYAAGAPVPSPYTSARGVSLQGRYMGSRSYPITAQSMGMPVALMILVGCPQPGIAPPPVPRPQPNPAGGFPEHSPALPGDHMAAGCDPLPAFPPGVTAKDVSDDDPRSYAYPPNGAQLAILAAQGPSMLPPGITPRMLPPSDPRSAFFVVIEQRRATAKGFPPRRRG